MSNREDFEQAVKEILATGSIEFQEDRNCYKDFAIQLAFYIWEKAKENYEPRWRNVGNDEDLPEEDIDVLCLCEDGTISVASHHNSFFTDDRWCLLAATHWTPLPSAHRDQGE